MKKSLTLALVILLVAAALSLSGCSRKVTVTTGEIVICTAGETIEDNTEQIEVPEDEAADYSVTTKVITCDQHSDLSTLYDEAQQAIIDGDLVTARERLATIVDRDPTYRNAQKQLDEIDSGATPEPDTGDQPSAETPETPDDPGTGEPEGPVVDLAKWVPDVIEGYTAQGIIADVASLSRQYLPKSDAADQLVIAVDQMVDAEAAAAEAAAVGAQYPDASDGTTVGAYTVTVGARDRFAVAAFADGPLLVVVELHGTSGKGADLIDDVLAVVGSITR